MKAGTILHYKHTPPDDYEVTVVYKVKGNIVTVTHLHGDKRAWTYSYEPEFIRESFTVVSDIFEEG